MVPGITETECRIAEFRFQELHAEAERQRRATHAGPAAGRVGVMEATHRRISALMEQASHLLQGIRTQNATEHAAAPGALAVSK